MDLALCLNKEFVTNKYFLKSLPYPLFGSSSGGGGGGGVTEPSGMSRGSKLEKSKKIAEIEEIEELPDSFEVDECNVHFLKPVSRDGAPRSRSAFISFKNKAQVGL